MNSIYKRLHLLCIAAILSSTAILLSCEREHTDDSPTHQNEEQNVFVGKWVLKNTIETTPTGTNIHFFYNLDYTLTITNDNRCKLEGTNVANGNDGNNTSGTKTFTVSKEILYKLENPKEITFYGATFNTEDGIKFSDNGYLLKDDNTMTIKIDLARASSSGLTNGVWSSFTHDNYEVEFVRR